MKNFYEILGVEESATGDDIKKAYRKMAIKYHPDKNPDDASAEEKFKQIAEAYDAIGDDVKRKKYDTERRFKNQGGNEYFDFMRDTMFSQGWSTAFDNMYGGGGAKKGPDASVLLTITMKESYSGTSREVKIGDKTYRINIKKGVQNGQKLRIKGLGQQHPFNSNLPKGDLIIIVTVLTDESFIRRGSDLFTDISVHIYKLMAGGTIEVPTPEGSLIHELKPLSEMNIMIPNCGMPHYDSEKKGNLIVKIHPVFPTDISEAERELITKLGEYAK